VLPKRADYSLESIDCYNLVAKATAVAGGNFYTGKIGGSTIFVLFL